MSQKLSFHVRVLSKKLKSQKNSKKKDFCTVFYIVFRLLKDDTNTLASIVRPPTPLNQRSKANFKPLTPPQHHHSAPHDPSPDCTQQNKLFFST